MGIRRVGTPAQEKAYKKAQRLKHFEEPLTKKQHKGYYAKEGPKAKPKNWTEEQKVGDRKVQVRKGYAKALGKKGRKKLVTKMRKKAIGREVSKALGKDPDKKANSMFKAGKKLYGDWLGNKKKT